MCRGSALICFGKESFVGFSLLQAQMKLNSGWMKRVSFIWPLKPLKRMTTLNLSGQRTMRDLQILSESRLKRRAIGECPLHTEEMHHGLVSKEHMKHQEKGEGKCFPLLSLIPSPGVHERGCSLQSGEQLPPHPNIFTLLLSVIYKSQ